MNVLDSARTQYDSFEALQLDSGRTLSPVTIAYETYGQLNAPKDNAILLMHALSGSAHAGFINDKGEHGWWEDFIGPGGALDTDRYFVICSNVLGGCSGSTGPGSVDPATGRPYGLSFPVITIGDMVRAQKRLVDSLEISELLAVVGGSVGGMQALQWAVDWPEAVRSAVILAAANRLSAQGLALARMIGHITYLSEESMHEKFGRTLKGANGYRYHLSEDFEVESYLHYKGNRFVERFDANSYLYITKAMDYFDLPDLAPVESKMLVVSFSSDWLFPPAQSKALVRALRRKQKDVTYCDVQSSHGHDAFLLEIEPLTELISGFLANVAESL
jgi:homoserine O-acetyltransferase